MELRSTNAFDAKKEILRIVITSDYHHAKYRAPNYWYTFVYFSAEHCRFYFESQQRKHSTEMIRRYKVFDPEDAISIVASKYTFSQICIGAINARRIMTYREFFSNCKEHWDWV